MKVDDEYDRKYHHIPSEQAEIVKYIEDNYKINPEKLKAQEDIIDNLQWKEINFTIYAVPTPSPRPRYSFVTKHFYVKGAADNKRLMKFYVDECHIIYTRVEMTINTYQPIPTSSMTSSEVYLAEKGLIRPIQNADWDNYGKTYSDMIQGILILNDNIISTGIVNKYFSLKPRIEIKLRYQDNFDCKFNMKKITNSTAYKTMMEKKGLTSVDAKL